MQYFFHFLAGDVRLDDDFGLQHGGISAARAEAIHAARDMVVDALRRNEMAPADGVIEISDERGRLVAQVSLTEAVFGAPPETRYRRVFDTAPQGYLLLAPDLTIVDANRAYLRATMTELSAIERRRVFDAFPEKPDDPERSGVRNLSASFEFVLRHKVEHAVSVQRFDIRRPDGTWEERHWKPVNMPILDANGEVEFILQQVEDVTAACLRERTRVD